MYCKNCGRPMGNNATFCLNCGFQWGTGNSYCPNCGRPTIPGAAICVNCSIPLTPTANPESKSKMAAGLLGIFLGSLGIHNFYLGYTTKAVIQLLITLLTCGAGGVVSGIWGLIEGIMILTGRINVDGKGFPLRE